MTKKIVVLIRSDPRKSHRPCEGIRIALGLAASDHDVHLIFAEKSPHLLAPDLEDVIDEDLTIKYLETLKVFIPVFYIDEESACGIDLADSEYASTLLSKAELASKIESTDCFAVF